MARPPGTYVEPAYGRLIKLYCQEMRVPQGDLADEIGVSYPTLSRGINGHRVDPGSKQKVEGLARRIAVEHPDMLEQANTSIDFSKPIHIVARRLADKFDLESDQALRIARAVMRGLKVFI